MKRKAYYIILFFVCLIGIKAFSYPFENCEYIYTAYYDDLSGPSLKMAFKDGILELDIPELDSGKNEEGIFIARTISEKYSVSQYKDFLFLETKTRRFMVLYFRNLVCVLIDCTNNDTFWGIRRNSPYVRLPEGQRWRDLWVGISDPALSYTNFSSILKEKQAGADVVYNGKAEFYLQIKTPWVPSDKKNGINEWIEKEVFRTTDELVLINGFVRADKPDWYYNNARIKEALIETSKGSWAFSLKDSPHPQIITLPEKVTGKIKLIIKDVYKGDKYTDLCLGGLYALEKVPH